jgi:hypothetical protein
MEQRFSNNSLDLETLREFCKREGEAVTYRKGDQLEREGDPARWLAHVESGCFKYVTHGISDDKAPIKREPSSSLDMAERELLNISIFTCHLFDYHIKTPFSQSNKCIINHALTFSFSVAKIIIFLI